jgi:alanine racemase
MTATAQQAGEPSGDGGVLTIDLDAVVRNYRLLAARAAPAVCAAVVKANAYGLGLARVAPALAAAGCREFFVAHLAEGIALRRVLGAGVVIAVLHGPPPGDEAAFPAYDLCPVLNSAAQIAAWRALALARGVALPAALQFDTGMHRLGLPPAEMDALDDLAGLAPRLLMSHLACADTPAHPANERQRAVFAALCARLPGVPASLAASSGIFLGPGYHCDLVRPGAALYGIAPGAGANPLHPVVRLSAPVIQCRAVAAGDAVGYGQSWQAAAPGRIATIAIGYADGLPRSLGNRGCGWFGATRLPLVGRVSMDSITLDVSALPPEALARGAMVDLIGPHGGVDALATAAGTIGYELLCTLGPRLRRVYLGA